MSDHNYENYLQSLHAHSTPDAIVADIIKKGTNQSILSKNRIIAGEESEVYSITLNNKQKVILRIAINKYPDFTHEVWAIDQCKKVGVPVPNIIDIQHFTYNDKSTSACIMEEIDGTPLERGTINFWQLDETTRKSYIYQAGEILSKIHTIKTVGFGEIDANGKAEYQTLDDVMNELLAKRELYYDIPTLNQAECDKAFNLLDQHRQLFRQIHPCLNHADFSNKHFMIKNEKIVAIIDWGDARSDIPHFDFANWDYWYGEHIPTKWLMDGYLNKSLFDELFDECIHTLRLFRGLEIIRWYYIQNYTAGLATAIIKLSGDLKHFKVQ